MTIEQRNLIARVFNETVIPLTEEQESAIRELEALWADPFLLRGLSTNELLTLLKSTTTSEAEKQAIREEFRRQDAIRFNHPTR